MTARLNEEGEDFRTVVSELDQGAFFIDDRQVAPQEFAGAVAKFEGSHAPEEEIEEGSKAVTVCYDFKVTPTLGLFPVTLRVPMLMNQHRDASGSTIRAMNLEIAIPESVADGAIGPGPQGGGSDGGKIELGGGAELDVSVRWPIGTNFLVMRLCLTLTPDFFMAEGHPKAVNLRGNKDSFVWEFVFLDGNGDPVGFAPGSFLFGTDPARPLPGFAPPPGGPVQLDFGGGVTVDASPPVELEVTVGE